MKGLCWSSRVTEVAEVIQTTQTPHSYGARRQYSSPPGIALPSSKDVINSQFPESYSAFLPKPPKQHAFSYHNTNVFKKQYKAT